MKKFYILALVAAMFAACATDATEDVAIEAPETLKVSFEESSRIQLNNNQTVWTANDLVSVFYRSDANQQWKFQGKTGDRSGQIKRVSSPEYKHTTSKIVIAYPYNVDYYLNPETCNLQAFLPAEQTYLKDSYGINGNIMVSQSEYKQFVLKSVCGWVKIQLTGDGEKIQSIKLKGNNGEQVAGELYVNTADATSILAAEMGFSSDNTQVGGTMVEDDTILTEVTLNCGEGVTLGKNATAFYIGLPPQTFGKGLTVEVACSDGSTMTKSTEKEVVIARNTIQPMAVFEYIETQSNNEIWYTSSDGNVVTPYNSNVFGANIVSNTYENGKGVIKFDDNITSIGEDAFYKCTSLASVTIGDSVTSIGEFAFSYCTSLTSITIGNSVTSIGNYAFYGCTSLTSVTIPDSVTSIGNHAFSDCTSLASVTIPDSVTSIGEWAFYDCTSLTSVTIGDSVTSIGEYAFLDCTSLTSVTIPDSVTSMGEGAFYDCTSLTSVTIGDSVTEIGDRAFQECTSLTSVTIPDSVTLIRFQAFANCTSLTSVTIPDSVTSIGENAFYGCTSLKEVYYNGDLSAWCKINFNGYEANPMYNGAKLYLNGVELTEATIPSNVTEIKYTFAGCTSLTSVTIGDSVTSIGWAAFFNCTSLTSVTIPDSVTEIESTAFYGCTSLTSVTIPDSVTEIGSSAFYGCTSLTSVTIPDSVTLIRFQAFANCTSLTSVAIPDSVTEIGSSAFYGCTSLTSVTIGNSVTSIGFDAFYGCTSLISITIPNSVTKIGGSAFRNCTLLTSVAIPDSVTEIGKYAFRGCTSLTSITIPDSVTEIGDYAFSGCTSLKEAYCKPTTPPSVGDGMLYNNASGRKIYVPRASVDAYKAAQYWSAYKSDIEPYDFE